MLLILPIGTYFGALIGLAIAEAIGGMLAGMFAPVARSARPRRPASGLQVAQYVVAGLLAAPAVVATIANFYR